MALHEQSLGATDEWYTPPHVFKALGCAFDLDVAAPIEPLPWIPARDALTSDALERSWGGAFVWMNPPFGGRNGIDPWLEKFWLNGRGIALAPDRTSAPWYQKWAPKMDCVLFVNGKLKFLDVNWRPGESPAQGTVLMACGEQAIAALYRAEERGLGFVQRSVTLPASADDAGDETGKGSDE